MQNLSIYKLDNKIIINVQLNLKCDYVSNKMKNNSIFYRHIKILINIIFTEYQLMKKYMHHKF